ncbi:MAG: SPASM domain-containing protein [Candidatus Thiodiazotropha taylori]|nr:SPASM domain-containing protein [Candidatus Thiodiazotropha taylori]
MSQTVPIFAWRKLTTPIDLDMHIIFQRSNTLPSHPDFHLVRHTTGNRLFEVKTGRLLELEAQLLDSWEAAIVSGNSSELAAIGAKVGATTGALSNMEVHRTAAVQSLSLAIAQSCNLGCTYCYAEQGTFGEHRNNMSLDVAKASVDRLFQDAPLGQRITLAFMGGEPLFNRMVLHKTTAYAAQQAENLGRRIAFAITTNATLIRNDDVDLFQKYCFTVTVSIDGIGIVNDQLRPYVSGKGTYERIKKSLGLLFSVSDRKFKVLARVTVTPKNLDLLASLRGLLDLGFDSVQFSPILSSPTGMDQMMRQNLELMLKQLVRCGEIFRFGFENKQLVPITNVLATLKRIHFYQREVYPCGAGGGYMGVSAQGDLYACHRFINDDDGYMGNVEIGVDLDNQSQWLASRHLTSQGVCNTCWARHLCSGSCHHEVINRGRPACDYIRGWLYYCLGLYADLMASDPVALRLLLGDKNASGEVEETLRARGEISHAATHH